MKHIEISSTTFFGVPLTISWGCTEISHNLRAEITSLTVHWFNCLYETQWERNVVRMWAAVPSGKRCVTSRKTAAKETASNQLELKQKLTRLLLAHLFARCPRVFASGFYWCAGLSLSSWLATEEILQAMKQTMKRSIRLMQARHVVDLLPDLTQTEHKGYSMTVYSFLTVFKTFYSVSKEYWRRNVLKFKLSFPNSFLALVARVTDYRKKEVQILANAQAPN